MRKLKRKYLIKKHYIKLFLAPVLWGGALVGGRIIAGNLPPFTITLLRFIIVSLFSLPILYFKNGRLPIPSCKAVFHLMVLGLSGVLMFNFFLFSGLRTVSAIRSSIFISVSPFVVLLSSGLVFHEKITKQSLTGIILGFSGAIITITNGNISLLYSKGISAGDLFLVGCIFSWTIYSISAKYALVHLTPLTMLAYSSVLGVVFLIPFALKEGVLSTLGTQPSSTWLSLLYLSIGASGLAHIFYYQGIKAVGTSRSAIFLNLEPVAAISLSIIILGETLSYSLLTGAVLVISGLLLTNYKKMEVQI